MGEILYDTTELRKVMDSKNMSRYELSQITMIPQSSIALIIKGKAMPSPERCKIIADALEVPVFDIFKHNPVLSPELASMNGGEYNPSVLKDEVVVEPREMVAPKPKCQINIGVQCMMTGNSALVPEFGYKVKARKILTQAHEELESLSVSIDEQVRILTGIKASDVDISRMLVMTDEKLMIKNEFRLDPFPRNHNGEIMVFGYCHGHPLMIYRGLVLGNLIGI